MCLKLWNMDYNELLENAHTPMLTLSSRRSRASLRHLSKIVKKQTYFPAKLLLLQYSAEPILYQNFQ